MKSIFASKTFWANILAIGVIVAEGASGISLGVSPELQTGALGIINILLRLVTKDSVRII